MKNQLDLQRKKDAIELIKQYFKKERDEELGDLGAELIFDFFTTKLSPIIYNQAIDDIKLWFQQKLLYLETDLESLKKDAEFVDPKL